MQIAQCGFVLRRLSEAFKALIEEISAVVSPYPTFLIWPPINENSAINSTIGNLLINLPSKAGFLKKLYVENSHRWFRSRKKYRTLKFRWKRKRRWRHSTAELRFDYACTSNYNKRCIELLLRFQISETVEARTMKKSRLRGLIKNSCKNLAHGWAKTKKKRFLMDCWLWFPQLLSYSNRDVSLEREIWN